MGINKNVGSEESYQFICKHYKIDSVDELKKLLEDTYGVPETIPETKPAVKQEIVLPFCGNINTKCCKAVVYNHGLYTQCSKQTNDYTCKACSKLKYGDIESRVKCKTDEFVTPEGKKEIPYHKFIVKMEYKQEDVNKALHAAGIVYKFAEDTRQPVKKGRGRPKKIPTPETEGKKINKLEVTSVEIDGSLYFKTVENVLLNRDSYSVMGLYADGGRNKPGEKFGIYSAKPEPEGMVIDA